MKSFTKVALLAATLSTVAVPVCSAMDIMDGFGSADSVELDSESSGWGSFFLDIVQENPIATVAVAGIAIVMGSVINIVRNSGKKANSPKDGETKTVVAGDASKVDAVLGRITEQNLLALYNKYKETPGLFDTKMADKGWNVIEADVVAFFAK